MYGVDLAKNFHMSIYLRSLASIQPRTSLLKFEGGGFSAPVMFQRFFALWIVQPWVQRAISHAWWDYPRPTDSGKIQQICQHLERLFSAASKPIFASRYYSSIRFSKLFKIYKIITNYKISCNVACEAEEVWHAPPLSSEEHRILDQVHPPMAPPSISSTMTNWWIHVKFRRTFRLIFRRHQPFSEENLWNGMNPCNQYIWNLGTITKNFGAISKNYS